jgi:hypothetical protein
MTMRRRLSIAAAAQLIVLAGCVPQTMAPTVVVTPGPSKSSADFAVDQTGCTAQANQQMAPAIQAANTQLVGNALLAVTPSQTAQSTQSAQVTLQRQYDAAYSQCMYAKGDIVPGMTPTAAEEPGPVTHHARHYAHKTPPATASSSASSTSTSTSTSATFVEPAPAATGGGGFVQPQPAAAAGGGGFVQPQPAAAGSSSGFALPPPASH